MSADIIKPNNTPILEVQNLKKYFPVRSEPDWH